MPGNHLQQQREHIVRFDCTVSMKHMALPRKFVDNAENAKFTASLGVIRNKVPGPHMILVFGLLRQACGQASAALSRLEWWYLQSLLTAYALHLFLVHPVAFFAQHMGNLLVAIGRMLSRQAHNRSLKQSLPIRPRLGAVAQS